MERKKMICLDFDGVLHSYTSGWKGATEIPDPPVHGALEWLKELLEDDRFEVAIYSSRSGQEGGIHAMQEWLRYWWQKKDLGERDWFEAHGTEKRIHEWVQWPTTKPPAHITIDDRAWQFKGVFPSLYMMDVFQPWNKPEGAGLEGAANVTEVFVKSDGQVRVWK